MSESIPEIDCDVAVIGGGIAGLSAALSAMNEGAEVILLEKAPKLQRGGNSAMPKSDTRANRMNTAQPARPEKTFSTLFCGSHVAGRTKS